MSRKEGENDADGARFVSFLSRLRSITPRSPPFSVFDNNNDRDSGDDRAGRGTRKQEGKGRLSDVQLHPDFPPLALALVSSTPRGDLECRDVEGIASASSRGQGVKPSHEPLATNEHEFSRLQTVQIARDAVLF